MAALALCLSYTITHTYRPFVAAGKNAGPVVGYLSAAVVEMQTNLAPELRTLADSPPDVEPSEWK